MLYGLYFTDLAAELNCRYRSADLAPERQVGRRMEVKNVHGQSHPPQLLGARNRNQVMTSRTPKIITKAYW